MPRQGLGAAPANARARFALDASATREKARAFDALGELSAELSHRSLAPILTAELELHPARTHVIAIDSCRSR